MFKTVALALVLVLTGCCNTANAQLTGTPEGSVRYSSRTVQTLAPGTYVVSAAPAESPSTKYAFVVHVNFVGVSYSSAVNRPVTITVDADNVPPGTYTIGTIYRDNIPAALTSPIMFVVK